MARTWLVSVLVLLAFPATSGAVDLRFPDGRVAQPYQRWTDAALVPTPPGTVTIVTADCPNSAALACVSRTGDTMWIQMPYRRQPLLFFHELGHVFDFRTMSPEARDAFQRINGTNEPWIGGAEEEFADRYALCALTRLTQELRRACSMIRRQAARRR